MNWESFRDKIGLKKGDLLPLLPENLKKAIENSRKPELNQDSIEKALPSSNLYQTEDQHLFKYQLKKMLPEVSPYLSTLWCGSVSVRIDDILELTSNELEEKPIFDISPSFNEKTLSSNEDYHPLSDSDKQKLINVANNINNISLPELTRIRMSKIDENSWIQLFNNPPLNSLVKEGKPDQLINLMNKLLSPSLCDVILKRIICEMFLLKNKNHNYVADKTLYDNVIQIAAKHASMYSLGMGEFVDLVNQLNSGLRVDFTLHLKMLMIGIYHYSKRDENIVSI